MFGEYLKKYRIANGLTQNQAVAKLNLLGGDLTNIDNVTFSRWERGATTPTLKRSIRVLREFTNNLEPYLSETSRLRQQEPIRKIRIEELDMMMKKKYYNLNSLIARANYHSTSITKHNVVSEYSIGTSNNTDPDTIQSVLLFHKQTSDDYTKHGLRKIDVLNYCNQKRLVAYKYVDNITGELLGHNVGAIFTPEVMHSEIETLNQKSIDEIDLRRTVPYSQNRKLVYFLASQHSLYERPFKRQIHRVFKFLAEHANITDCYTTVSISSSVELLEKMGFSIISYEKKSTNGAIKVGMYQYSKAIMHIKTSQLFAQPEFLHLLKDCQICSVPCSVNSQHY